MEAQTVATTYGVVRGANPVFEYLSVSYRAPSGAPIGPNGPRKRVVSWLREYNDVKVMSTPNIEAAQKLANEFDGRLVVFTKTWQFDEP
jgi:hypothetical protein